LLYRHDELRLQVVEHGRPWSFDGDGHLFPFGFRGASHPPRAATQSGSGCCGPVLFQLNGDFVVAAEVGVGNSHIDSDAKVSNFSETGGQDPSFSSTPFTFGGNTQNETQAIALQSNGPIVVGGITNAHGTPVTGGLARLDSSGDLDTTFASGASLMSDQIVSGLLIQSDGKIVAIGGIDGNLVLERYLANWTCCLGLADPHSRIALVANRRRTGFDPPSRTLIATAASVLLCIRRARSRNPFLAGTLPLIWFLDSRCGY
jgi:hypothetical protein